MEGLESEAFVDGIWVRGREDEGGEEDRQC